MYDPFDILLVLYVKKLNKCSLVNLWFILLFFVYLTVLYLWVNIVLNHNVYLKLNIFKVYENRNERQLTKIIEYGSITYFN